MIQSRKPGIAGVVIGGVAAVAVILLLVYAFAPNIPQAVPALVGSIAGAFSVYFATRFVTPGETFVGRLVWKDTLVVVAILGFTIYLELPGMLGGSGTALGGLVRGLGFGSVWLAAFLRLVHPYSWVRGCQER